MELDCRGLYCPEPVIRTKKTLDELEENDILDVLVNSNASVENVKRYAISQGFNVDDEKMDGYTKVTITKGYNCELIDDSTDEKVLFLKDDKIGEGELGEKLMIGFLNSILELPKLPAKVICVNKAVFLTTKNAQSVEVFEKYIKKGIEIFSCGVCLEFYKLENELKVGEIGNAYSSVEALMKSDGVISL